MRLHLDTLLFCNVVYSFSSRATSAAPIYFKPIKIGSHSLEFVDGGIGANNPVFHIKACARDKWPILNNQKFDERIGCLVSIGTGAVKAHSANPLDMLINFSSIVTETEDTAFKFSSSHDYLVKKKKYFRLTVPCRIGDIDLADSSKLPEISGRTYTYLKDNCNEQLDQCAEVLRKNIEPRVRAKNVPVRFICTDKTL